MNRMAMMLAVVAGLGLVGCEKKDVDAAKAKAKDVGAAVKDTATKAAEATKEVAKDATEATKEAAKAAADKTEKAVADATAAVKEKMSKAMGEWQPSLDGVTKQVEGLKGKVDALPAEKKATALPELKGIEAQLETVKSMWKGLNGATADNWEKLSGEFSGALQKLGPSIKTFAEKYGLTL